MSTKYSIFALYKVNHCAILREIHLAKIISIMISNFCKLFRRNESHSQNEFT